MNTNTGRIYRTPEEIAAARARGEPLAEVSEQVADLMEHGQAAVNRKQRRYKAALIRRAEHKQRQRQASEVVNGVR